MDYPKSVAGVGLVNGKFVDEDQNAGTVGSIIPSAWGNAVTDEILAVIALLLGAQPDEAKKTQLRDAVVALGRGVSPATTVADTGVVNALVADLVPAPQQLETGIRVKVKTKVSNTDAVTFNLNGTGAKPIVGQGLAALQGGELPAGRYAVLEYDATLNAGNGAWVLVGVLGGGLPVAAPTKGRHALNLDTGDARYAALAGLVTQAFNVGPPTLGGHAVNLNEFFCSLTQNGCVKIPVIAGGIKRTLIIQWGQANAVPAAGGVNVTFPLAFPTAFLMGLAGFVNSGGISAAVSGGWGNPTPTGMTVFNNGNGGASAISWLAIGY